MRLQIQVLLLATSVSAVTAWGCSESAPPTEDARMDRLVADLASPDDGTRAAAGAKLVLELLSATDRGTRVWLSPGTTMTGFPVPEDLTKTAPRFERILPALLRGTRDQRVNVRLNSASALGLLGARSMEVVDALLGCLTDDDVTVRDNATGSLASLGPELTPWRNLLVQRWEEADTLDHRLRLGMALLRLPSAHGDRFAGSLEEDIRSAGLDEIRGAAELFHRLGRDFMVREYPQLASAIREMGGDV